MFTEMFKGLRDRYQNEIQTGNRHVYTRSTDLHQIDISNHTRHINTRCSFTPDLQNQNFKSCFQIYYTYIDLHQTHLNHIYSRHIYTRYHNTRQCHTRYIDLHQTHSYQIFRFTPDTFIPDKYVYTTRGYKY